MKRFTATKRTVVALGTATAVLLSAGIAAAYWTGTVATTASPGTVTANGTATAVTVTAGGITGLKPDATDVQVPVTLHNPNTFAVGIPAGHVSGAWASASPTSCTEALALLTIATGNVAAQTIAAGSDGAAASVPVRMALDTSSNANACQGAVITLNVAYSTP